MADNVLREAYTTFLARKALCAAPTGRRLTAGIGQGAFRAGNVVYASRRTLSAM